MFALQCPTETHKQSPISTINAGHAMCVPSVQDTELKGHGVLLLSPVKCHHATPTLSSPYVSHVTSLWTLNYSLTEEVHENIKRPTNRSDHFLGNVLEIQYQKGKMCGNWALLSSCFVYWRWRLEITQEVLFSAFFFFCLSAADNTHFCDEGE